MTPAIRPRKPITSAATALRQAGFDDVPGQRRIWQLAVDGRLGDCVMQEPNGRGRWSYYEDRLPELAQRLGLTAITHEAA